MSNWITKSDYVHTIQDKRLNMMLEDTDTILDVPEQTAIQVVRDALHSRFDVDAIFATTGDDRPKQVLKWCIDIAIYFVYERVPDKLVPERIKENYARTLDTLLDIADGKKSIELPRLEDTEGNPKSKFRWGSKESRSY